MTRRKDTRPTFIYVLKDPRNGEVRYVGKTVKRLENRLADHLCAKDKSHRYNWIKSLKNDGIKPTITLIQEVPYYDDWQYWERFWIKLYRGVGYRLVNGTDGGEGSIGCKWDDARKEHHRAVMTGRKMPPEAIEKIRKSNLGRNCTPETRQKLRVSHKSQAKPVAQYTREGKFIDKYESMSDAVRAVGIGRAEVTACCKRKIPTAGSYQWRYWEDTLGADIEPYIDLRLRPVAQYTLDWVFIKEWGSATEAGQALGINNSNITACAKGRLKKASGFIWAYINSDL